MRDIFISVIVPIYQNCTVIERFCEEVVSLVERDYTNYEILMVDDGTDCNFEVNLSGLLKKIPGIRYIRLTKQVGANIAVLAGLEHSIGDVIVVMDAAQDAPEMLIQGLAAFFKSGKIIYGMEKKRKETFLSRILSALFNFYCRKILNLELPRATLFRVLSRQNVNLISQVRDRYPFLRLFSSTVGIESEPLEITSTANRVHKVSEPLGSRIDEGIEIILSSTKHPLRIAGRIAMIWAMLLFFVSIYSIFTKANIPISEFSTIIILGILFVQCEYLGRILEESQSRPIYQIRSEKNSQVLVFSKHNIEEQPCNSLNN